MIRLWPLALALAAAAQVRFHTEKLHGREAYVLENGVLRLAALRGGGHLAEIRFVSPDPRK